MHESRYEKNTTALTDHYYTNILDSTYMRPWDLQRPGSALYNRTYSNASSNGSSCDTNKYSYAYQHLALNPNRPAPPTATDGKGRFDPYQDPKDCIHEIMNQLEESGEEIYTEFNGGDVPDSSAPRVGNPTPVSGVEQNGSDDDDDEEGLYDLPYDSKKTTTTAPGYSHVMGKLQRQQKLKKEESVETNNMNKSKLSVSSPPPVVSPNGVDDESFGCDGNENIYQNSLKLLDEIEYIDTAQLMRKIQSKPDSSSGQIVVEPKSPMPMPRQRDPVTSPVAADNSMTSLSDSFNNSSGAGAMDALKRRSLDKKDISSPMLLGGNHHIMKDRKVIPVMKAPQPAPPRPKSKHDPLMPPAPPAKPLSSNGANLKQFPFDNNNSISKNDHLTTELKTKVRAVRAVPSLTGGHSDSTLGGSAAGVTAAGGRSRYENNVLLK